MRDAKGPRPDTCVFAIPIEFFGQQIVVAVCFTIFESVRKRRKPVFAAGVRADWLLIQFDFKKLGVGRRRWGMLFWRIS